MSCNTSPREYTCEPEFWKYRVSQSAKSRSVFKLLLIAAGFGKNTELLTLTSRAYKNQEHRQASFLRQPRLAQSVERELQHRLVFQKPFDGEIGFETTRFSHGGFRLIHFALECVGGGQIEVGVEDAMAALDRLLGVFERFVKTPEAEFRVGAQIEPLAHRRVARTEQHGLLDIGFGLLKTAQIVLRVASQSQQPSGVWINRKPGVESAHRIFGSARDRQVLAFGPIGVDIVAVERDGSVDRAEDRCVI